MTATVFEGDCLEVMQIFNDNEIDAIVTDPPYALTTTKRWANTDLFSQNQSDVGKRFSKGFMGKEWDGKLPGIEVWQEALRVCKPGAHMCAFGGTRTHHRLMVAIEDAGWEIRDTLMWVYGSGFPKSNDISKAIDREAGVEREVVGRRTDRAATPKTSMKGGNLCGCGKERELIDLSAITAPATDAAKQWDGWGTALKPAWEPIILCRKPISEKTVAQNVLKWGTGGLNIDGCRIPVDPKVDDMLRTTTRGKRITETWEKGSGFKNETNTLTGVPEKGRFPANLIHDGSDEVLALFPESKGQCGDVKGTEQSRTGGEGTTCYGEYGRIAMPRRNDSGSAARFFYCAKASKSERNLGCENLPLKTAGECTDRQENTAGLNSPRAGAGRTTGSKNHHPTVKPLTLLQYLCRLITPPVGLILDPFAGSGSTGIAATREGFNVALIEIDKEYCNICRARNKS
jgi:DNA modification methylase